MADLLTPDKNKLIPVVRTAQPTPTPEPQPMSAYSAALSQDQQTQTDTLGQVYRGTAVVRHSPLPISANIAANAAANSAAQSVIKSTPASGVTSVGLTMPGIFVNPVSGSIGTGDVRLGVALANEPLNTVFAGPTNRIGNAPLDVVAINSDDGTAYSADPLSLGNSFTASITPTAYGDFAVYFVSAGVTPQSIPAGFTTISGAINDASNPVSGYIAGAGTTPLTAGGRGKNRGWVEIFAAFRGSGAPAVRQFSVGFNSVSVLAGSTLLAFYSGTTSGSAFTNYPTSVTVTDTQGNVWNQIAVGRSSITWPGPPPEFAETFVYLFATTVTTGGTLTASIASANDAFNLHGSLFLEVTNLIPPVFTPTFRPLVVADIPSLPASIITSGQLGLAFGGTGVDLSTSGGANQFLAINASHVISAAQPSFANLSGNIAVTQMNSGTGASASTAFFGDGTWKTVSAGVTSLNSETGAVNLVAGSNVTITPSGQNITIAATGGGGSGALGGVNPQTANYTAQTSDNGKLISFSGTSTLTLTLPNPPPMVLGGGSPPSDVWMTFIEFTSTGSGGSPPLPLGSLTINRNGLLIDGKAVNLSLTDAQGIALFTDGTNYFTERGIGGAGGGGGTAGVTSLNSETGAVTLVAGSNVTITPSGQNITIATAAVSNPLNFIQAASSSVGLSQAYSANVTTGSLLLCAFSWGNNSGAGSGTPTGVTDTQGNAWSQIGSTIYTPSATFGGFGFAVFKATAKSSAANTVTATLSASFTFNRIEVLEYSSPPVGTLVDVSATNTGTGTAVTSGNITTTTNNDTILELATANSGATMAAATGYNARQGATQTNGLYAQDKLLATAGTTSFSGTLSASSDWASMILAVFPATGAPTASKYVLGATDPALPNAVANPTAYYGVDVQPASAGTLDDEFNTSTFNTTRWTWVNQGSATATQNNTSLVTLYQPNQATDNFPLLVQTAPATPWEVTWKVGFGITGPPASYAGVGLVVRDSGTGKFVNFLYYLNGATTAHLDFIYYTNPTTFSSTPGGTAWMPLWSAAPFYLRLKDDGTNFLMSWSYDGNKFTQIYSFGRTAFLATPNQVGMTFTAKTNTAGVDIYATSDWFRRTL